MALCSYIPYPLHRLIRRGLRPHGAALLGKPCIRHCELDTNLHRNSASLLGRLRLGPLKMLIDVWVRTGWIAFFAKCSIILALLLLVDVALGVAYPAPPAVRVPSVSFKSLARAV